MFLVTFKLALINALYQVNFAVSIRQLQIYLTLQHHYDGVSTYCLPNNTNENVTLLSYNRLERLGKKQHCSKR